MVSSSSQKGTSCYKALPLFHLLCAGRNLTTRNTEFWYSGRFLKFKITKLQKICTSNNVKTHLSYMYSMRTARHLSLYYSTIPTAVLVHTTYIMPSKLEPTLLVPLPYYYDTSKEKPLFVSMLQTNNNLLLQYSIHFFGNFLDLCTVWGRS
jgi:hypothetical protein